MWLARMVEGHMRRHLANGRATLSGQGFPVLPKRWIVERTFAWMNRQRRLSKDYERLTENSEAAIYIAMIDLVSKRLANASK